MHGRSGQKREVKPSGRVHQVRTSIGRIVEQLSVEERGVAISKGLPDDLQQRGENRIAVGRGR